MRKRKTISRLKTMAVVPLGIGTMAYLGDKLPTSMGTTMSSSLQGAAPMAGMVVGVSALGLGVDALKDISKSGDKLKYKKPRYKKRKLKKWHF